MSGLDLNEIGSGSKAWSTDTMGDAVKGRIRLAERRQQRGFDGGAPLTWDDGSPRMLTYIELETDLRDPDSDDDDGVRALYAKGGNFEVAEGKGTSMERAIVDAVKKAGASSIDVGAILTVGYTGVAKRTNRAYQPAKLYTAKYEPPTKSVDIGDLFDD